MSIKRQLHLQQPIGVYHTLQLALLVFFHMKVLMFRLLQTLQPQQNLPTLLLTTIHS